ncbi:glycosyltransferase [Polaribacter sp. Z022]|uniref:glycosyltransferase family 2 protein n=1 Tax=Polaribacter sp. Z022 TaxID=2927125 RepID=UPI0020208752|nr:glycosyltransferase [Polaribacter sp. Z022]MCL7753186.1 glycosyltransferase [Polaribacter sp. Z022]
MSNPLISIIIPVFNREHLISETLNSILAQTYLFWECIIIDDGSTDNTLKVVESYCVTDNRFRLFKRPVSKVKGANSCRNLGFDLCNGDYIKWFDSDDLFYDFALEKIVNKIKDFDVCVSKLEYFTNEKLKKYKVNSIYSQNLIEDYFIGKITFYVSGPTWKKSFLESQKYLFDESISNLDDWDFNLRMLYKKPKINFIDKSLIKYRIHDNSLSKEIEKLNFEEIQSEFKAREKHLELLKKNNTINSKKLKVFIKNRYKYFLRESLIHKDVKKYYFLKKTLIKQIDLLDFLGFLKTIIAFIVFMLFNRGYKILK